MTHLAAFLTSSTFEGVLSTYKVKKIVIVLDPKDPSSSSRDEKRHESRYGKTT